MTWNSLGKTGWSGKGGQCGTGTSGCTDISAERDSASDRTAAPVFKYSGMRPRVITADGSPSDFIVSVDRTDPPLINLIGIESPGLSAALALARHVGDLPCIQRHVNHTGSRLLTQGDYNR